MPVFPAFHTHATGTGTAATGVDRKSGVPLPLVMLSTGPNTRAVADGTPVVVRVATTIGAGGKGGVWRSGVVKGGIKTGPGRSLHRLRYALRLTPYASHPLRIRTYARSVCVEC